MTVADNLAFGLKLFALFHLVALREVRRGGAGGLRWGDLDLDAGRLTVAHQLQQLGDRAAEEQRWAAGHRAGPHDSSGAARA
jgi:hypothetical protein